MLNGNIAPLHVPLLQRPSRCLDQASRAPAFSDPAVLVFHTGAKREIVGQRLFSALAAAGHNDRPAGTTRTASP